MSEKTLSAVEVEQRYPGALLGLKRTPNIARHIAKLGDVEFSSLIGFTDKQSEGSPADGILVVFPWGDTPPIGTWKWSIDRVGGTWTKID